MHEPAAAADAADRARGRRAINACGGGHRSVSGGRACRSREGVAGRFRMVLHAAADDPRRLEPQPRRQRRIAVGNLSPRIDRVDRPAAGVQQLGDGRNGGMWSVP